jgi:hypothetical protein
MLLKPEAAVQLLSYHDALAQLMSVEPSSNCRNDVVADLPLPPSAFMQLLCLAPPDLKPALKEQHVSLW